MNFRLWLLAALVALAFGTTAYAAPPVAPVYLSGVSYDNGVNNSISLSWQMPQGSDPVMHYRVYGRLQGTSFAYIDTAIGSNEPDSMFGHYNWHGITVDGVYDIYVTAVNPDGEGASSDTITVEVETPPFRFINWPSGYDSLYVGVEYNTTINVVSTSGDSVRYAVHQIYPNTSPLEDATIDPITGEFSWTPSTHGFFQFAVIVSLTSNPMVQDTGYLPFYVIDPNIPYFVSNPLYAQADTGITVQNYFRAEGGGGATITYGLISISDSANIDVTIDPNSGLGSFTGHAYGMYQFQVGAYLDGASEPAATQNGYLRVRNMNGNDISVVGIVVDSSYNSIPSLVKAFVLTNDSNSNFTLVDSMWSNTGYFDFRGMPHGAYILHATPYDTNHAPAYYRANFDVALVWEDATIVDTTALYDSVNIVVPVTNDEGSNSLRGSGESSNGQAGSINVHTGGRSLSGAGTPLSGAAVYALTADGRVAGSDITDAEGRYEIHGLGAGTFTVIMDKVNYISTLATATFAEDNGSTKEVNVTAERVQGTAGVMLTPVHVEIARAVPTPTRERATLHFNASAGNAQMSVVDLGGHTVRNSTLTTTPGENLVVLETNDLAAGTYTVRIVMGSRVVSAPLVIVR